MTTIKATCPTCGEVGLTPDEVELRIDRERREDSYYAFTCPECGTTVRKPADERVVKLLVSGGVEPQVLVPSPPALKDRFPGRPRFSYDDLLDFHSQLATDGWFAGLIDMVRPYEAPRGRRR